MFAALPMYRPSLPHPGATPNVSPVTRGCCTRAAGENSMFTALPTYKPSLPRCPASARYYPTRLFSHARTLPPCSGRNLHVCCLSNVRAVAVTLPRVVSDTAPNVSSVTRNHCPHAGGATSMFEAFPTYKPSLPHPGATPHISSVTRERCPRAAGATRILQFFQRSRRRCPHFPAWPPDTAPTVFPVTRERFPHAAGATSSHRGRGTSVEMEMLRCGCPRATGATRSFQSFQRTSRRCHHFPASPPMLLQMSFPSCANASPTQRVQPPCLQPSNRLSRHARAFPQHRRMNAAPAQRARRAFCSLHFKSL